MNRTPVSTAPLLIVLVVSLTGCYPTEDSCNIKTDGIYVQFEVTQEGDAATGKATFWVGDSAGGTNLKLSDGSCADSVRLNGEAMTEKGSNPVTYQVKIDAADSYDIVFEREDGSYLSTVSGMQPEPTLTAPSDEAFSRAEDLEISWDGSGDGDISLLISGACIFDYSEDFADNGDYTVSANNIEAVDSDDNANCDAEIVLSRAAGEARLDSDLKGEIKGETLSRTDFTSTP